LPAILVVQVALRLTDPAPTVITAQLQAPPAMSVSRLAALGKPAGLVRILTQRPQNFDTQPGISNPFRDLDCDHLISSLDRILELDATSGYLLLLASHVVSQVLDGIRQRAMPDFVYRKFLQDPARRWR